MWVILWLAVDDDEYMKICQNLNLLNDWKKFEGGTPRVTSVENEDF